MSQEIGWNIAKAHIVAKQENIELSTEHIEFIYFVREFYTAVGKVPNMRAFINFVRKNYAANYANLGSNDFYKLYPAGLSQLCKIAGLPKPISCI